MRLINLLFYLAFASFAYSTQSQAHVIYVDGGDAQVGYRIPGSTIYNVSGYQTGDLNAGSWQICIHYTCIPFQVNTDGSLSGVVNNSVDFVNDTIQFKP